MPFLPPNQQCQSTEGKILNYLCQGQEVKGQEQGLKARVKVKVKANAGR